MRGRGLRGFDDFSFFFFTFFFLVFVSLRGGYFFSMESKEMRLFVFSVFGLGRCLST